MNCTFFDILYLITVVMPFIVVVKIFVGIIKR